MTARCPRCNGTLRRDQIGHYCLMCGRIVVQAVTDAELATYTASAPVGVARGETDSGEQARQPVE
jgi:DNA polymerase II large subunit